MDNRGRLGIEVILGLLVIPEIQGQMALLVNQASQETMVSWEIQARRDQEEM